MRVAMILHRLGRFDEAYSWIDRITSPARRTVTRARLLSWEHRYAEAYTAMQTALDEVRNAAGSDPTALLGESIVVLGGILFDTGSWEELLAIRDDIERFAGSLYHLEAEGYRFFAVAAHKLGKEREARDYLAHAEYLATHGARGSDRSIGRYALSLAEIELGLNEQALDHLEEAYRVEAVEPTSTERMHQLLELMLRAIGDADPDRYAAVLQELETRISCDVEVSKRTRMAAAWLRARIDTSERGGAALATAYQLATEIIGLQGDSPLGANLRLRYPYCEILEAAERG